VLVKSAADALANPVEMIVLLAAAMVVLLVAAKQIIFNKLKRWRDYASVFIMNFVTT
jgi:hypothetical protein